MAEADAEDRHLAEQLADVLLGIADRFRVAGAVAEKDAVRVHGQHLGGREIGGDHGHIAAAATRLRRMLCLMPKS